MGYSAMSKIANTVIYGFVVAMSVVSYSGTNQDLASLVLCGALVSVAISPERYFEKVGDIDKPHSIIVLLLVFWAYLASAKS